MDLGLDGRRAIVSGGSRGIGRAIVQALADEGCAVAFCARDAAQVATVEAALREAGADATGTAVDVSDRSALESWIESAAGEMGGIDIVVPNVSAMAGGPDEDSN